MIHCGDSYFCLILLRVAVFMLVFAAVVQSLSRIQLFATPWLQCTTLPCPSLSLGVCSNSCPLSQWRYLTVSSSTLIATTLSRSIYCCLRMILIIFQTVFLLLVSPGSCVISHMSWSSEPSKIYSRSKSGDEIPLAVRKRSESLGHWCPCVS